MNEILSYTLKLASKARRAGDLERAECLLAEAVLVAERADWFLLLQQKSYLLLHQGHSAAAAHCASTMLGLAISPGDQAKAYSTRGSILTTACKWMLAQADLRKALQEVEGDYRTGCINNLVACWCETGAGIEPAEIAGLLSYLERASSTGSFALGELHWTKGGVAWRYSDYEAAERHYLSAYANFIEQDQHPSAVGVMLDLARLELAQGKLKAAGLRVGRAWKGIGDCSARARRAFVQLQRQVAAGTLSEAALLATRFFVRTSPQVR